VISMQENAPAPTITSSTSRRIRTGTAALAGVEFPSNSRSYKWGRRRKSWLAEASRAEPQGYELTNPMILEFPQEYAS